MALAHLRWRHRCVDRRTTRFAKTTVPLNLEDAADFAPTSAEASSLTSDSALASVETSSDERPVNSARINAESLSTGSNERSEPSDMLNLEAATLTRAESPNPKAATNFAPPSAEPPSLDTVASCMSESAFDAFLAAPRDCAGELQDWLSMRPRRTSPARAGRRRLASVFEALQARRDR